MATTLTVDAFLDVVRRSRLMRPEELEQVTKDLQHSGVDLSSPQAIAQALTDRQVLTRWQADYLLQGKHKGFFLGPYRFLKMLGKGGMGAVYLAQHEMMKRRCAIKVLPTKLLKGKSSLIERFYLEAQAVASLDHPNIVRAYDVNKETVGTSDIHYLVMEYVEGRDLQTIVEERGSGLDLAEVAEYARQAAAGLAHAHESGLIHRDIKPANLLVDAKGTVKILDLGLARFFDDRLDASLTKAYNESLLGTADYLSPEQALNSHQVDTRTDIYSLGCTCYFMLTGQPPFPDGSVAQRLIAHQVKSPTPIEKLRPDVPGDLVSIVEKMIAKKAEHRFASAADVVEAFGNWLQTHSGSSGKSSRGTAPNGSSGSPKTAAHEPTRTRATSTEDTEVEMELAPQDDAVPLAAPSSEPAANSARGSSRNLSKDATMVTPAPGDLEALPDSNAKSPEPATPPLDNYLLSQPLDDLFADSADDPLAADAFGASPLDLQGPTNSGIQRQPAPAEPAGEGRQLLRLLLIGLAISIPLALVILFVSDAFKSTSAPATASVADASPRGTAQTSTMPPQPAAAAPSTTPPAPASVPGPPPVQPVPPPANGNQLPPAPAPVENLNQNPQTAPPPSQPAPPVVNPSQPTPPVAPSNPGNPPQMTQPSNTAGLPGTTPEPAGGQPAAPPPEKQPKSEELSSEERAALLASLRSETICVVPDHKVESRLERMIARACLDAWQMEGLRVSPVADKDDRVQLKLAISYDKITGSTNLAVRVSVDLQILRDGGKRVSVLKSSNEIGELPQQAIKRDQASTSNMLRPKANEFFQSVTREYREAL
jgi:serine/threonine-protein kinase